MIWRWWWWFLLIELASILCKGYNPYKVEFWNHYASTLPLTPCFIRAKVSYFDFALGHLVLNCWKKILAILILENFFSFQFDQYANFPLMRHYISVATKNRRHRCKCRIMTYCEKWLKKWQQMSLFLK